MASLVRHDVVLEPNEFGRRAADASDRSEDVYRDTRSAGLLNLEDTSRRYPGLVTSPKRISSRLGGDHEGIASIICPIRFIEDDVEV